MSYTDTTDKADFERAVEQSIAVPGHSGSLATMMRLAIEARSATLRGWAAQWLFVNHNVRVTEDQENDNATPAQAKGIR